MTACLTKHAIEYTLRQLLQRAGAGSGVPILYQPPQRNFSHPCIFIVPCRPSAWDEILQKPAGSIQFIPANQTIPPGSSLPFENDIPVLFRGAGCESETKFAEQREDGAVVFYVDILAAAFFMLTRWEETVIQERDIYGRFSATQSVAYKQGFLNIPLIDQYALIIRQWLKHLVPHWSASPNKPALYLTHDIDFIHQYSNPIELIRAFGIAALSPDPLKRITHELKNLYNQLFAPLQEERLQAVYELAELSQLRGFKSHFYFMAAKPHPYQQGYDPALPQLKSLYQFLLAQGHEIGLHPGYTTFRDLDILKAEKENLERASGVQVTGGRQHFLRFEVPQTWRDWEQAGLQTDSTLGYADCEGFRCGTCHPFQPFDFEGDREINLLEIPLVLMDTTLVFYRRLSPQQALPRIQQMAKRCFEVEGTFTVLWHNTMLLNEGGTWKSVYAQALDMFAAMLAEYSH